MQEPVHISSPQKSNKNNNKQDIFIGKELFHKYILIKKLGEGSFGKIYSAKEKISPNYYAIKFENKNLSQNLLEQEANIMSYLRGPYIPFVKSFGYSGDYNVLIMELMGKSLEDLFESLPTKKMSVRCVCNLGYQMIDIMKYIHQKHYIHQDIKPDNFVMGNNNKKKNLFILDFGLSKKYRSSSTLKHYPLTQKKNLTGTARYASVNALNGFTQSRRDDLEAIGYVLMYFLIGRLPWQGMVNKNKNERYKKIMEVKRDTDPHTLCQGFPPEFERYVSYTRNLEYEEEPDYDMLKNLFLNVLNNDGYNFDYFYDWDYDAGTFTTCDTNFNFVKINNKINNENKQINNKAELQIKEKENEINDENKNDNKKINNKEEEKKEEIKDNKLDNEKNISNHQKEYKEEKKDKKSEKNENKEINKNNDIFQEEYISGIIEAEEYDSEKIDRGRRNKKNNTVQCCLIM